MNLLTILRVRKQVPCWGPTDIRLHRTNVIAKATWRQGYLQPWSVGQARDVLFIMSRAIPLLLLYVDREKFTFLWDKHCWTKCVLCSEIWRRVTTFRNNTPSSSSRLEIHTQCDFGTRRRDQNVVSIRGKQNILWRTVTRDKNGCLPYTNDKTKKLAILENFLDIPHFNLFQFLTV